jgi:hypothetical protein
MTINWWTTLANLNHLNKGSTYKSNMFWHYSQFANPLFPWSPQSLTSFRYLQLEISKNFIKWLHSFGKLDTFKHQSVEFTIRRFCDYVFTLVMKSYKTCFLWLYNFLNKKNMITLLKFKVVCSHEFYYTCEYN